MNDKASILIVDDYPDNLSVLFEVLRRAGYEVMVAPDGPGALLQVELHQPDLILLDLIMPGLDGFEVAARLKARPSSRDIPIIFLTGLNDTASIVKGFEVGGVDFLVKPLRMAEALARINTHVSLYTLRSRLEARTRELTSLLELSHSLILTQDLERLANVILDQLKTVVDYTSSALLISADGALAVLAYRGPQLPEELLHEALPAELLDRLGTSGPMLVADLHADAQLMGLAQQYLGPAWPALIDDTRAWMGTPLLVNHQIIGALSLSHHKPGAYTTRHAELLAAFANQAAVAIQNARLYQQVQQVAVHEERNRLARTLHDSVTQSLFSASLIAEVLPQIWRRDPSEGQQGLAELLSLTKGALTEMRTLLLELRPATLLKTRLDDLLRQLTQPVVSQTLVQMQLDLDPAPTLPAEVHVTFYRVAQETLNNVAKHAQARKIVVTLRTAPHDRLTLAICDDGRGFDLLDTTPGRLGLEIMHERARQIGARLTITSQPGAGTQVELIWPDTLM